MEAHVYVCVCMRVQVWMHMDVCVCIRVHMHMCVCVHAGTGMDAHTYVCAYIWSSEFDVTVFLGCFPLSFTAAGSPEEGALPFS